MLADHARPSRWKRWRDPAIVVLAALLAVAPMIARGPSCAGDFYFHFVSWLDAQRSVVLGVPNPHWANAPNLGAGEPRFIFYPPLTWVEGAVLGLLLPWPWVPVVFVFLQLAATGLANRLLAREMLPEAPATLAGCASIFLAYPLFSAYDRGAYAELTGGFWIPLLLLFLLRRRNPSGPLRSRVLDGSAAPLALVFAGAWLSNGPAGIMATYLLVAVALLAAIVEKSPIALLRGLVSGALGIGLAAIYLLPAVWEKRWINLRYATTNYHYLIENGWLFARHAEKSLFAHDVFLRQVSWLAVFLFIVAVLGALIAWVRGTFPPDLRWSLPLVLIPVVVLLLQLPISLPLWNALPEWRLLQFPWRWLLVLEAPAAIFLAAAVWVPRPRFRILVVAACAAACLLASLAAGRYWYLECHRNLARITDDFYSGAGLDGMREYAPPGVRYALVDRPIPPTCLLGASPENVNQSGSPAWDGDATLCSGRFAARLGLPEHKRFTGIADRDGFLVLRLRSYPAWKVTLNGHPATAVAERVYGLIAVPVQQGNVDIAVDWTISRDVIAGRCISAAALLLLAALWIVESRRARLS